VGTSLCDEVKSPQPKEDPKIISELEAANKLFNQNKLVKSEEAYRALRAKKITDTTWAMTSNNLGINLRVQKKYKDSIKVLSEILNRKLNNRDPGPHIMEPYRNYHYNACIEISRSYLGAGDYNNAIKYMKLTRKRYVFQTDSGTSANMSKDFIDGSIEYLEKEMKRSTKK